MYLGHFTYLGVNFWVENEDRTEGNRSCPGDFPTFTQKIMNMVAVDGNIDDYQKQGK